MILDIENVSKSYDGKTFALKDVNIHLTPGIYGLLGPNGSGKSTLMNIITDNLATNSGVVKCDGIPIKDLKEKYRDRIGYMPQQQQLYDNFTGEEFLWYFAALKNIKKSEAKDKIDKLLETMNLVPQRNKKIKSYSGGMKQRILIAQAMLNDPDILIMDEPTAGLDPSERIRIRNFLSTLSTQKVIIVATHIVSDIEFIAKKIILLKSGEVIACDSPSVLLAEIKDRVFEIEVGIQEEYINDKAQVANIRMGAEEKIYRVIQDEVPEGYDYKTVKPGLEDLYLYYFLAK